MRFRTRIFLSAFGVAALSLLVASLLVSSSLRSQMLERIQRNLVAEARLAAELLAHADTSETPAQIDEEADAVGRSIEGRVTLIAADGRVLGDSDLNAGEVDRVENHAGRPEVVAARRDGIGISQRYSTTVGADMLYVAVPVRHPSIAVVRLALPLTDVQRQVQTVGSLTFVALGIALASALALAWITSSLISRRVQEIAALARRYSTGDIAPFAKDFGDDEIGRVARVLDESVHELGRRLAELARDRARMETMLSGMIEGVLVINAEGRLQLANDAARRMLGLQGSAIGRHYLELLRQPDVVSALASALQQRVPPPAEISLTRDPDRVFLARASPVVSAGGNGAVLVMHDITELRRADQIRRDFVANVSHELRTPLTAIRGYVEALQEPSTQPEEGRRFLEVIVRHADRMERLVQDLLRLARLDAGQEPLDIAPCSTETLFTDVLTELDAAIEAKQQQFDLQIAPDAAVLAGDSGKLHDVMRNLVENAVNYSPSGTTILLKAERRGGRFLVSVADEGPGIPAADLTRVFERFYRVDRARSRHVGGTGLGLAIVKHLVGLHGGDVTAANRPQGGTIVTVALPVRPDIERLGSEKAVAGLT